MNYLTEFRKFLTGQYLNQGLRVTAGAIVPALVLYQFGWLTIGAAMPLGALMVSLTDTPGPIHHRRNGMLASNILNFLVAILVGFTRYYPWLLAIELTFFSFTFSLISIYGNRASSVGLIAMLIMVLNIDVHHQQDRIWSDALFMLGGGLWYMLLSLTLYKLRPYRLIQQALGESIHLISNYLKAKARLYNPAVNYDEVYKELLSVQVEVQHSQEQLRELLYKARDVTRESTAKGRSLLMMFLDSIDLFEQVMTTQYNYATLHKFFDRSGLMEKFNTLIMASADEIGDIGLAVQTGIISEDSSRLETLIRETESEFVAYRDKSLNPENLEGFISLRHVLNSIKDVADRIRRIRIYTNYSVASTKGFPANQDFKRFIERSRFDPKLLLENFTLKSNSFRHALRVSISVLVGYLVSQLLAFGHSYWILLTIITILKPAYSISKRRNAERLAGTVIGAFLSFLSLYFIHINGILFLLMILAMIAAYSFLQIQYLISVAGITIYVLISFHFLHPVDFRTLVEDRVIDTAIGSAISFLAAFFILPRWEHEQVSEYVSLILNANLKYFQAVTKAFYSDPVPTEDYKYARKQVYVALANFSDAFQRSLSEPKNKLYDQTLTHQLVVSNHMLSSHIASLSTYAYTLSEKYRSDTFIPVVNAIEKELQKAISLADENSTANKTEPSKEEYLPIREIVGELWNKRIQELQQGEENSSTRKELSGLKTITDQFEFIQSIILDIIGILKKMNSSKLEMKNA
ncbi:MAG: FUSC family protein [Bacteroidetes bacterium]|nr:MAG: FUSC family protein [Bacteroidota bacterium]